MNSKRHICLELFRTTLSLSACTFGGGYVIISLMKKRFVDGLHWMDEDEVLNLAAIAQSSPGAVAVNASILLGYRMAGLAGALVSIAGTILPPLVIISIISCFYTAFRTNVVVSAVLQGMQAGVAAVIADVVLSLGDSVVKSREWSAVLIMAGAFLATYFFHVNVMYIILVCGCFGAAKVLYRKRRGKEGGDRS